MNFEYAVQKKEGYPVNNEDGIFFCIVHPRFGDVQSIQFHRVDFREEQTKEEKQLFISLNDVVGNDQIVNEFYFWKLDYIEKNELFKHLTGGFRFEVKLLQFYI